MSPFSKFITTYKIKFYVILTNLRIISDPHLAKRHCCFHSLQCPSFHLLHTCRLQSNFDSRPTKRFCCDMYRLYGYGSVKRPHYCYRKLKTLHVTSMFINFLIKGNKQNQVRKVFTPYICIYKIITFFTDHSEWMLKNDKKNNIYF